MSTITEEGDISIIYKPFPLTFKNLNGMRVSKVILSSNEEFPQLFKGLILLISFSDFYDQI